jgi:hypothetical protein
MWLWLKSLLKVAVGTIIFWLVLLALGIFAFGAALIAFIFGFFFWLAWELHRWEKKHGLD